MFRYRSHPDMGSFQNKKQHRATTSAIVAAAVAVVGQTVVSLFKSGWGCHGASRSSERQSKFWRVILTRKFRTTRTKIN